MTPAARSRVVPLGLAFGASGGAGLLAEQSFEKLLGTLLGMSTPAGAVVLATYFLGLTLGGWRYARRRGSTSGAPARALGTYASLEAIIALACAVLATFAGDLVPVFVPVLRLGAGSGAGWFAVRLAVAACWILPVTVPMGATFAAVVDGLDVVPERSRGSAVSAFYALNLIGAVAAAALGPYLVFPRVGVDGALALAALLDCAAACVALESAWAHRDVPRTGPAPVDEHVAMQVAPRDTSRSTTPLIAMAALSGFVLFALEVVWTHLIGAVLGGSVYAFGTMLAVVLSGLGLGAAVAAAIGGRLDRVPAYVPGIALALAAVALLVGHGSWPEGPHELAAVGRDALTFAAGERARAGMAVRLLLVPAALLGTVYPLVLRLDAFPAANAGSIAGRMGAANAVACIAGALVTGFVGIPRLGGERMLLALAALCLVAGGAIMIASSARNTVRGARGAARLGGSIACAFGLVAPFVMPRWNRLHLTSGEQVYFHRLFVYENTALRFFHEDTSGGFTTVVENGAAPRSTKILLTNGKFQGSDVGEMDAQDGFALAPTLFARHWDDALVIGLGTGRTAHVVASMGFERVTIAEIAPGMVEAARREFAHVNQGVLERPNVAVVVDDARNFLLVDPHTFDLITTEIASVWIAGATNLYSREFYDVVRRKLRTGGVFQQWVQLHHIGIDEITTVIASMRESFAFVSLFVLGGQGVLVGTQDPQLTQREFFTRFEAHAPELGDMEPRAAVERIHASRLLGPRDVDAFLARRSARINTDQNRRLEYATARYGFDRRERSHENVRTLADGASLAPQPVGDDVTGELASAARALTPAAVRRTLRLTE